MRKYLIILCSLICLTACADEKRVIDFNSLPQVSQDFITRYALQQNILLITQEGTAAWTEYEVKMEDKSKWEFNAKGLLKQVEMATGVPASIVPTAIVKHVETNYPQALIVQYSIDRREQEVELNNGLELTFDLQGKLKKIE